MKKLIAATFVATTLFSSLTPVAVAGSATIVSTKAVTAYSKDLQLVRTLPMTSSSPIALLKSNKKVKIINQTKAGWSYIQFGTTKGWVSTASLVSKKVVSNDELTLDFSWITRQGTADKTEIINNNDGTVSVSLSTRTKNDGKSYQAVIRDSKGKLLMGSRIEIGRTLIMPVPYKNQTYRVSLEKEQGQKALPKVIKTQNVKMPTQLKKETYLKTNALIPGKEHDYVFAILTNDLTHLENENALTKVEAVASYMVATKFQRISAQASNVTLDVPYQSIFEKGNVDAYEASLLTTSLLRELGVPTRLVRGTTIFDKNYYHTWNEVFVEGKWRTVDMSSLLEFEGNPVVANSFTLVDKELLVENTSIYQKKLTY